MASNLRFDKIVSIIQFPALNFVLDNLGLSCYVPNNFYTQLLVMTLAPFAILGLMLLFGTDITVEFHTSNYAACFELKTSNGNSNLIA